MFYVRHVKDNLYIPYIKNYNRVDPHSLWWSGPIMLPGMLN